MNQQRNLYFASSQSDGAVYDIYDLFQYYDKYFFQGELERCTVRWTKRMTLCAGTCKYEGFGSSTISLSQPLLKFRSSNQLKQTLLHQMIHAYLFKTNPAACQTQGGHGPAFVQIMHNINNITGLKLTVYHSFHDQVDFYRQHIWRCNGRCKDQPPFYGYVKRSMNRPPQPADHWWAQHKRLCGGDFAKVSEPQKSKDKDKQDNKNKKIGKKPKNTKRISQQKDHRNWGTGKTIEDYIKQMNKSNQQKNKKQENKSTQETSKSNYTQFLDYSYQTQTKQTSQNIFSKKAKTIEQYFLEMQKQQSSKIK